MSEERQIKQAVVKAFGFREEDVSFVPLGRDWIVSAPAGRSRCAVALTGGELRASIHPNDCSGAVVEVGLDPMGEPPLEKLSMLASLLFQWAQGYLNGYRAIAEDLASLEAGA